MPSSKEQKRENLSTLWLTPNAWSRLASRARRPKRWPRSHANWIDDRLATKDDVELVRAEVKQAEMRLEAKIAETKVGLEARIAETNARISESKADIIKWVIGIGFAQTAMILGVLKFHG